MTASLTSATDRVAALAVIVAVVLLVLVVLPGRSEAVRAPTPVAAAATVVVAPGDTVLGIARAHAGDAVAPMLYASHIAEFNGIDSRDLRAGMVLRLPAH